MGQAVAPLAALGGGVLGGGLSLFGANRAERSSQRALNKEIKFTRSLFDTMVSRASPFYNIALETLGKLARGQYDITASPEYKFSMKQAKEAFDRRAKAMGKGASGESLLGDINLTNRLSSLYAGEEIQKLMNIAQMGMQGAKFPSGETLASLYGQPTGMTSANMMMGTGAGVPAFALELAKLLQGKQQPDRGDGSLYSDSSAPFVGSQMPHFYGADTMTGYPSFAYSSAYTPAISLRSAY